MWKIFVPKRGQFKVACIEELDFVCRSHGVIEIVKLFNVCVSI